MHAMPPAQVSDNSRGEWQDMVSNMLLSHHQLSEVQQGPLRQPAKPPAPPPPPPPT